MDFSAELLITELAPADALIQRAGRCARYKDEHGEIVICPVEEEKGHLPYEKEHLDKTLKWLKENRSFNVRDSNDVCSFVDILDYKAIDIEARDTLIDLHECVLYADSSPGNIQLRDGKPVYLVVVNLAEGDGRSTKDRIKNTLRKAKISENTINVDLNYAWKLFKEQVLQIGIDYNFESKEWNVQEITEIQPFKYYIIDSSHYEAVKGISLDASTVF
jgi:CRISPR-associated endonuclease/helicase Cas3